MDNRLMNISRRAALLAAIPVLVAGGARADSLFTNFAFLATGGTATRTEPNRWADWHNVKDFGAVGDGAHDDTANIQAAINWTALNQRGTIYFPPGSYRVTGTLSLYFGTGASQSIILRGDGTATVITGTVNGYILDRFDPNWVTPSGIIIIEKMQVQNGSQTVGTGAIRLGNTNGAVVRDCSVSGMNGVVLNENNLFGSGTDPLGAPQYLSENTLLQNCTFGPPGTRLANSNGIVTGNGTTMINMDGSNWDCMIRVCGKGNNIVSGRFEENNYGHIYGVDHLGNAVPAVGCSAGSFSMESNRLTMIDFVNASQCVLFQCGGIANSGTPTHAVRLRSGVSSIIVQSVFFGGGAGYSVGVFAIEDGTGTPGRGNTFIGGSGSNLAGPVWSMPTKALTAKFINSDNNPAPIFTFANLPGSGDRVFGDEYIISNSTVVTSAANFGATVAGGGANTAKVRWNGSNWTIC